MQKDVAERFRRLEASEAIRQCVYSYALAGDRGNAGHIVTRLFTEEGSYEAPGFGRFEGRANVVRGLEDIAAKAVLWAFHIPGGPLITLSEDGQSAKAFWWVFVPVKLNVDGQATPFWGAGHYNADLVIEAGQWKFHRVLFETKLQTPFAGPWTQIDGKFEWPE
ncbi:MAG: nuclear transport factor 2 family protein [Rhodospirillaceae bacterium]|nr:nuclear transport factor 2 family protein [Rhodospirillaceae bacterium]